MEVDGNDGDGGDDGVMVSVVVVIIAEHECVVQFLEEYENAVLVLCEEAHDVADLVYQVFRQPAHQKR